MTATEFNAMYWAAQPDAVRSVIEPLIVRLNHGEVGIPDVEDAAFKLAQAGQIIDRWIMVWGMDQYQAMLSRSLQGMTWYPSLMQAPLVLGPGVIYPNVPPYDPNNPPLGSVKISLDPKDYPAFNPPKPVEIPTAVPAKPMFTVSQGPGRFSVLPGDSSPAGTIYSGPEGSFVKQVTVSPFGAWSWWEVK